MIIITITIIVNHMLGRQKWQTSLYQSRSVSPVSLQLLGNPRYWTEAEKHKSDHHFDSFAS